MPLLFRIVLPNSRLHTVHDTFHFQAKELNFCISFSFLRWLFANSIRPPKGLHAVNLFATLELHQLAELRWESHETAVCRSTWDSDICSFCSSRSKTHAALSGKLNAPIWNTVPFLSPVFCDVQIKLRLQIDLDLLLRSVLKTSAWLSGFHHGTFCSAPTAHAFYLCSSSYCGCLKWYHFPLIFCLLWPCWLPWCSPYLFSTWHLLHSATADWTSGPVLTTNYSPQWGKPD